MRTPRSRLPVAVAATLVMASCSLSVTSGVGPAGPEAPGGGTTVTARGAGAFSEPAANLTEAQVAQFLVGDRFFTDPWTPAGDGSADQDGLGPTFLTASCAGCHPADGRGSAPDRPGVEPIVRFVDTEGHAVKDPSYGIQLQRHAIGNVPPEAALAVTWEERRGTYPDGTVFSLRSPLLSVTDGAFGDLSGRTATGVRIGPGLIGLGLLEAIDEADLRSNADPDDRDGDGVSGRVSMTLDLTTGQPSVGRFGLKSNVATLIDQASLAYLLDMGITTPLFADENCPAVQTACAEMPSGGTPEISGDRLDAVVLYLRTLGVPARTNLVDASVANGGALFTELGCASCHVSRWKTGDHPLAAVSDQTIYPYTDLLLHDMGPELSDGRVDGDASATEWRTPPLWGLGFVKAVNSDAGFLHDGRARTIEEAILWHGGEAAAAQTGFLSLEAAQREQLLHFLKSL